jgi:glycosyltransferase involved in cell wall biosynthesis
MSGGVLPISVIIPAYNREQFVGGAVRSAFEQSRPPAQVIVVDDGSTDRTAEIAASFGATVIRQTNGGVSMARNVGIRAASQPWVAFLDSDDLWLPRKLEDQWAALEAYPKAGMAFGDWQAMDESGSMSAGFLAKNADYAALTKVRVTHNAVSLDRDELSAALLRGNFIGCGSLVARRDIVESVGAFAEDMRYCEDLDLLLRLSVVTFAVAVEEPVYIWRAHRDGASRARAKMQLGRASIADRVAAAPNRYPPPALEYCTSDRPKRLKRAGMLFMRAGEYRDAADALHASLRYQFDGEAALARTLASSLAWLRADRIYLKAVGAWRRMRARP